MIVNEFDGKTFFMRDGVPGSINTPMMSSRSYCISFRGCVPGNNLVVTDFGAGLPIPIDSACVLSKDVDGLELPLSDAAAFIRIAVHMAGKGKYFVPFFENDDPGMYSDKFSDVDWVAEVSRHSGRILYWNSMWLRDELAADRQIDFTFVNKSAFRPLIVSGNLSWGTKAVFDGYRNAFTANDVDVGVFEYDVKKEIFSTEVVRKLLLAECCNVENGYSHLIVIDGLSIPPWVLQSCPLTKILVSTEDPHTTDIIRLMHPHYDYIFSNDMNMAEMFGVHYLPVAADGVFFREMPKNIPEKYCSDVLFLGAVYPSRVKMIQRIAAECRKMEYDFKAIGPTHRINPADLDGILDNRFVSTREAMLYQKGSKICINLFRDTIEVKSSKNAEFSIPGYSMNPRCYDVPMCGALLLTNGRPEVAHVFGSECLIDEDNVAKVIKHYVQNDLCRKEMKAEQMKTVCEGHLYMHRALVLIAAVGQGFVRRRQ